MCYRFLTLAPCCRAKNEVVLFVDNSRVKFALNCGEEASSCHPVNGFYCSLLGAFPAQHSPSFCVISTPPLPNSVSCFGWWTVSLFMTLRCLFSQQREAGVAHIEISTPAPPHPPCPSRGEMMTLAVLTVSHVLSRSQEKRRGRGYDPIKNAAYAYSVVKFIRAYFPDLGHGLL